MNKQINWGVLGCANIAIHSVIPAMKMSETGHVMAIASRGKDKAEKTASQLGIERAYGSYESLLNDPDIDAVYIPLPNHLHHEWTEKAAKAGKHVLCEKPLGLNQHEAMEMVEVCNQAGVKFTEAFMYRHHPRYDQVKRIIQSGDIGEIRGLHVSFTFNNSDDSRNFRFKADMGGGSIYDVGCYPINAARYLLDSEPEAVTVQALFSEEHDGVDMMASGLVEFPQQVGLTFDCGMWAASENSLTIKGTEGSITIPKAFLYGEQEKAAFTVTVKGEQKVETVPDVNQYTLQIDDFGRSVINDVEPRFPATDAIRNMRVIDAALKSAKERVRVPLAKNSSDNA